jgi:peroxiredoxin Q/BCP
LIIGISTDQLADQQKFTTKESLNFPLYADSDKKVARAFGVLMENQRFTRRVTFVIDKKGIVRKVYASVASAGKHPAEVLAFVKENLAEKDK